MIQLKPSWNLKHLFINGCFNWMIPDLYLGNGCFTKHPFKIGCLGYQVVYLFQWMASHQVPGGNSFHKNKLSLVVHGSWQLPGTLKPTISHWQCFNWMMGTPKSLLEKWFEITMSIHLKPLEVVATIKKNGETPFG